MKVSTYKVLFDWTLRAWDDVEQVMRYAEIPEQFDDAILFRFSHFETNSPIYMRSTGFIDTNGKQVYEGDIVIVNEKRTGMKHVNVGYVSFQDASFVIKNRLSTMYRWLDYDVEIIGNLYENTEFIIRYELMEDSE